MKAYISGNALIILDRPSHVLQTIYIDEESELEAVALDEGTGKLAACSAQQIYIYRPYGQDEGVVKVGGLPDQRVDAHECSGRVREAWLFRIQKTL